MENEVVKFRYGFTPMKFLKAIIIFFVCLCFVFLSIDFRKIEGLNVVMCFLLFIFFVSMMYFTSGFVLSLYGRYLIVSNHEIVIPHEFIALFDKKINVMDIKSIEKRKEPVEMIELHLKNTETIIITSELVLEKTINEIFYEIDKCISVR